jgi:hypothetical protein
VYSYIQRLAVINEAVKLGLTEASTLARPAPVAVSVNNDERLPKGLQNKQPLTDDDNPGASASSLLFYHYNSSGSEGRKEYRQRVNLYAGSFSRVYSASDFFNQSQGEEPIMYTPPLFPRIVESSILAESDSEFIISSSATDVAIEPLPNGDHRDAKRLRLDHELDESDDALFVALDLEDIYKEENISQSLPVPSLVEDLGMAGAGAVPLPRDFALAAAYTALVPMPHSYLKEAMDCFNGNHVSESGQEVL